MNLQIINKLIKIIIKILSHFQIQNNNRMLITLIKIYNRKADIKLIR